jgi:phage virion morphogenesis protein
MDIRFTFEDELLPAIERALLALADFEPAMEQIAERMEDQVAARFDAGKGPDGAPWQPSRRVLEEGGEKTLIDTRALLSSITRDHDSFSAVVGTNIHYAAIHQAGGTIRPRAGSGKRALKTPFGPRASVTMPARPFLGFGVDDARDINDIIADHLRSAFGGGRS